MRERTGRGLPELLTELGGPLRNHPAEHAALTAARDAAIRAAQASQLHACGWYRRWLAGVVTDGTLTRLIGHGEQVRLAQATRVLEHVAGLAGSPVLLPNAVIDRHGARPWRMTAADCLVGVRADTDQVPLVGPPQPTPWNTEVAKAMANTGHAVYEETVAGPLITDLAGDRPAPL